MGKQHFTHLLEDQNVGETERMISALAGGILLTSALFGKAKPLKVLAGGFLLYRAASGNCPARSAIGRLDLDRHPQNITIKTTLTINKPVEEVYAFWRNLENLPIFMKHLESVTVTGKNTSLWKAKIPGGLGTIDWNSDIILDEPNERLGWKSIDGDIMNAGTIQFRDGGKFGTEVHAIISYHAPAGIVGEGIGRLLNPFFESMVLEDVKNFKRYIESGEIPTIEGQAKGNN